MSDAQTLAPQPIPWEHDGKRYLLGTTDLELELLFQTIHEAWARQRIEASHERIGDRAYAVDVEQHGDRVAANRFAWGGPLNLQFLSTPHGQMELILLKIQKGGVEGGAKIKRDVLLAIQRGEPETWGKLVAEVLERDFPLVFKQARQQEIEKEEHSSRPATP